MKKKFGKVGLILALTMGLSLLSGCGKSEKKDTETTLETASVSEATATETAREFKVEDYNKLVEEFAPYCTLSEYKGLEYNAQRTEVTDEMVQERVDAFINSVSKSKKITEGVTKEGDTANIDYVGSIDGVEFQGGSTNGQGFDLTLGSGTFIPGMEEQIMNHKVGETFDINVTFPSDYKSVELAGKDAVFKITINYIVGLEKPSYTDELVASYTDANTIAEYEKMLKDDLVKVSEDKANYNNRNTVLDLVVTDAKVDKYPEEEMNTLVNEVISTYEENAKTNGMTLDELVKKYFQMESVDDFKKYLNEEAKKYLKQKIVVCAIAKKENMTLTKEEITAIEEKVIINNDIDRTTMENTYSMDDIIYFTISEKVTDFLMENAIAK